MKLIEKLKFAARGKQMIVLTAEEAGNLLAHIELLNTRIDDKEAKFMAMCDHTYDLVKMNRDLKKQLGQL